MFLLVTLRSRKLGAVNYWWLWDLLLLSSVGSDSFQETSCNEKWGELGKWLCNR